MRRILRSRLSPAVAMLTCAVLLTLCMSSTSCVSSPPNPPLVVTCRWILELPLRRLPPLLRCKGSNYPSGDPVSISAWGLPNENSPVNLTPATPPPQVTANAQGQWTYDVHVTCNPADSRSDQGFATILAIDEKTFYAASSQITDSAWTCPDAPPN
jgi:hypothetical protein